MEKEIFEVGLSLSFETFYKVHLPSPVVGWEKDEFVLTKAIFIQGQPSKLKANDVCRIRFLKDGIAYGFESEIITVQFFPYPLMFIKYPAKVEHLKIRINTRYKIDLPAEFTNAAGEMITPDAVLLDISEGGCGLKVPVQEGRELDPQADFRIIFKLMDRELKIGCGVRKFDQRGNYAYMLGMEFTNIAPQDRETLALFLDFLSKHAS